MVDIKIRQVGSSAGIILNGTLLSLIGAKLGDDLQCEVKDNKLILSKVK